MEDLQCRIVTSNYQLFVSGKKKKNKTYFSTNKKRDPLHIQKDLQMPQHSYLPANISFLCFVGHQGWIIHEPPFQMLIVSGGKGSARSASGKLQRFAAGTVLCAIQGPAVCSRVTGAAHVVPVASAVETAVCPQSVMAEMCGRLPPNSMPPPHTPLHTPMPCIIHHTTKGMQRSPMIWGTEWAMHHSLE